MIIKNNNKAVDVQKNHHVCWEARKNSQPFYVKKTKTLIKTEYGSDPSTIPNISWEGGTTEKFNLYRKETYSVREGFTTRRAKNTITSSRHFTSPCGYRR